MLKEYLSDQIKALLDFHRNNGGLLRYVKFRYFFEDIRGEAVTEKDIQYWADQFSAIMKSLLINQDLLIEETTSFVKKYHNSYRMHIVSGSDQNELRYICKELGISNYFLSIHGSPTPKTALVKNLLEKHDYSLDETVLIGDSINDYEAASTNNVLFIGYNNPNLYQYTSIQKADFPCEVSSLIHG
ncbi:HAD family hydrolase [Phaeodactylibacter xiamenensis]|uniref:HAD family hydrolase n=1 Tax=Phaeodactylibacter xiamenensis TaxID=1524460 RepID=UPI0024A9A377|nr:HAD hydrolase-like protein [Phaeodactylibacter xiamenensis]